MATTRETSLTSTTVTIATVKSTIENRSRASSARTGTSRRRSRQSRNRRKNKVLVRPAVYLPDYACQFVRPSSQLVCLSLIYSPSACLPARLSFDCLFACPVSMFAQCMYLWLSSICLSLAVNRLVCLLPQHVYLSIPFNFQSVGISPFPRAILACLFLFLLSSYYSVFLFLYLYFLLNLIPFKSIYIDLTI